MKIFTATLMLVLVTGCATQQTPGACKSPDLNAPRDMGLLLLPIIGSVIAVGIHNAENRAYDECRKQ